MTRADRILKSCRLVPLDTRLALEAAHLSLGGKLGMADAIPYATARREPALLVTTDPSLGPLPGVKWIREDKTRSRSVD